MDDESRWESGYDAGRESRDEEVRDLEDEVQRLQRALAFWLPKMPADAEKLPEAVEERLGDDIMLLAGYHGESEPSAEELAWIKLTS